MEVIDTFPKHRGRPPEYNWDTLSDGQVRVLTQGEDFNCDPRSFRTLVHRTKKQRGLGAKTRIHKNEPKITIQFFKLN